MRGSAFWPMARWQGPRGGRALAVAGPSRWQGLAVAGSRGGTALSRASPTLGTGFSARTDFRVLWQTRVLGAEGAMCAAAPAALGRLARTGRLIRRHQVMLPVADQLRAPHAPQRVAQHRPVVRSVIPQERLVQPANLEPLRNQHFLARAR